MLPSSSKRYVLNIVYKIFFDIKISNFGVMPTNLEGEENIKYITLNIRQVLLLSSLGKKGVGVKGKNNLT